VTLEQFIEALQVQVEKEQESDELQQKLERVSTIRKTWIPPPVYTEPGVVPPLTRLQEAVVAVRRGEAPDQIARDLDKEVEWSRDQRKKAMWEARKMAEIIRNIDLRQDLLNEQVAQTRKRMESWVEELEINENEIRDLNQIRDWMADWSVRVGSKEEELRAIAKKLRTGPILDRVEKAEEKTTLDKWLPLGVILIPLGAILAANYWLKGGPSD